MVTGQVGGREWTDLIHFSTAIHKFLQPKKFTHILQNGLKSIFQQTQKILAT